MSLADTLHTTDNHGRPADPDELETSTDKSSQGEATTGTEIDTTGTTGDSGGCNDT